MTTTSSIRPLPRPAAPPPIFDADARDLVGRFADFTLGTAVVLWHLALAGRDRRRRTPTVRPWSSTR